VLVAIVIGVVGFVRWEHNGRLLVAVAAGLGSLAGLEVAIREHAAGFRSHTFVLAASLTVFGVVVAGVAGAPRVVLLGLALILFAAAGLWLRRVYRRAHG